MVPAILVITSVCSASWSLTSPKSDIIALRSLSSSTFVGLISLCIGFFVEKCQTSSYAKADFKPGWPVES